ncbi:MAG: T9SS type A sorting domain-containing protein [Panacibacter sp.]
MKQKFLLTIFLAAFIGALAQPVIKKQRVGGDTLRNLFSCMALTTDGGFITGGTTYIPYVSPLGNREDFLAIKYNRNGNKEWVHTYDQSSTDNEMREIIQTKDGGYLMGGSQESIYWIVKTDSAGNELWNRNFYGSSSYRGSHFSCMQETKDAGFIIGGYSYSDSGGYKSEDHVGSIYDVRPDYWVLKLDSAGNKEWDKTVGGAYDDYLTCVYQTADGGFLLGGYTNSGVYGDKTEPTRGGYDYWIVKLDTAGKKLWDKSLGSNGSEWLNSVQETDDGGYILDGYSNSQPGGDKTSPHYGMRLTYDFWIAKLDAQRSLVWNKTIGGDNEDILTSFQRMKDGSYLLGGYSESGNKFYKTDTSRGEDDYWIVKTDSALNAIWDKTVGGNSEDKLFSALEIGKGKYVLGGFSRSDISGDKTLPSLASGENAGDFWIVGLTEPTLPLTAFTTQEADNIKTKKDALSFFSYPNPVKNILHVQATGKTTFTLTDQSGKIFITKTISGNGEINVSQLAAGLYYLKNQTTGETQKIIITK